MSNRLPHQEKTQDFGSFPKPKTQGRPLPAADRKCLEKAFGVDLSDIRIHCCPAYASVCKQLNAKAYAYGNDIVLSGKPDLFTLAHEAAHAVQQKSGVLGANLSDRKKAQPAVDCMMKRCELVAKSTHR